MDLIPATVWIVAVVIGIALWVVQFLAAVRTETHLKKIVTLLENESHLRFGAAQSLQRIQLNTDPATPKVDVLRSGI